MADKILVGAKENKTAWAEIRGRASHIAHLFGAPPPCITHSSTSTLLSPLCLPPRPYSSGPTCALSWGRCPVLCRHHHPCPIPSLSRLFCLCLLPMDFYFRAVCQVTHLFSWKLFLKTLGSRSLPGLSCHGLLTSVSIYTASGTTGTTHQKPLKFHSTNQDSI